MAMQSIDLRIKRQDGPDAPSRWEEFRIPYKPMMNVISALMEIQRNPTTVGGKKTTAPVWESNCLEEVCGACSMIINGKVRQACSTLIDRIPQPVVLEPMTKFPLVRDLMVDRKRMFEALKRVHAWIPLDGTYNLGPGLRVEPDVGAVAYTLSRCMTCGCCLEVCPQVSPTSTFIGAAAISQVRLFNLHPTGRMHARERLEALMDEGGLAECGNAQNCVHACPKEIPLTESIAAMGRETARHLLRRWLGA
ncbi:MAG TPA: succinate dehydrogenase iron-sulfur subunit [Candidatus Methylomirabilis sp.]|nr:succinate dehydrogenase iron-sulfur subunit [Candidatus Methylomirabilis sp.]